MAELADILVTLTLDTKDFSKKLKEVGQELNNFRNHMKQVTTNISTDFNTGMGGVSQALNIVSRTSEETGDTVDSSMTKASRSMDRAKQSSSTLARSLGTDFGSQYQVLRNATREFENFGQTGRRVSMEVKEKFAYLPRQMQSYVQRLKEAGESTAAFGKLNEMYGQRNVEMLKQQNEYMLEKATQSTKAIETLKAQNLQPLSQQFLKLGERLENNARQGSALNLALKTLGDNPSPKELADRMAVISAGTGRATQVMMGMGIVTGLALWGLVEMSNVVDGRLKPAFEEMKGVWLDALTPFVKAFTTFVVWIMEGVTGIGKLMKAFAEAHPQLSQMFWGFILLTMALTALLAPLAVCIGLAGGLSAGFALLWGVIGQFVIGFLTVVPVAMMVAAAIVSLVAVVHNMWNASEQLRTAWANLMKGIVSSIATALEPVKKKWEELKSAFFDLMASFTNGDADAMGEFWTWLGDKVAVAVNWITTNLLPIFKAAMVLAGQVVTGVLDLLVQGFSWLAMAWALHGDTIIALVTKVWGWVTIAFTTVKNFLAGIMPQVQSIVSKAFNLIAVAIGFVAQEVVPRVIATFMWLYEKFGWLFPILLAIVVDTWNTIKSAITNALNLIEGVIEFFTALLQGEWGKAWDAVLKILSSALGLLWDWIQLTILGKVLKLFKGLGGKVGSALSDLGGKIMKPFKDGYDKAIKEANRIKNDTTKAFRESKESIGQALSDVKDKISKPFKEGWEKIKDIPSKIVDAFAKMKIKIPKPKLPKIDVSTKTMFGGKGGVPAIKVPKFSLSWNAKGNIFNGASILGGGQGVGEAGAEAVMPIQHKRYMRPYASSVASHLSKMMKGSETQKTSGGNQYHIEFNEPVVIREDMDIQRIVDEMERRRKISERAKGVFSY